MLCELKTNEIIFFLNVVFYAFHLLAQSNSSNFSPSCVHKTAQRPHNKNCIISPQSPISRNYIEQLCLALACTVALRISAPPPPQPKRASYGPGTVARMGSKYFYSILDAKTTTTVFLGVAIFILYIYFFINGYEVSNH